MSLLCCAGASKALDSADTFEKDFLGAGMMTSGIESETVRDGAGVCAGAGGSLHHRTAGDRVAGSSSACRSGEAVPHW